MSGDMPEREQIPISALQHWMYCPRQCALIHVEQAWQDNVFTMRGHAVHTVVDDMDGGIVRNGVRIERSLPVWSDRWGLNGKVDLVEFAGEEVLPIDYKHGPRKAGLHDDVQVCAYALCLEEMFGRAVPRGAIYHHKSRRRRDVVIDAALREATIGAIAAVRDMLALGVLPPPVHDARCTSCSLSETCMPGVVSASERTRLLVSALLEGGEIQ